VTAAWLTIALFLVGLPLLAWFVGGCRFWTNLRGRVPSKAQAEITQRYGLSPAEVARVQAAMKRGQALDEPRLRAATADWARESLRKWESARRGRRIAVRLVGAGALLVIVGAVISVFAGDGIRWSTWLVLGNVVLQLFLYLTVWPRMLRNLDRAVAVNSEPVP
jgi:MFS family permease